LSSDELPRLADMLILCTKPAEPNDTAP
jgi:hypothetical protein